MVALPTLDDLPGWARALLESERVAHLGIIDSSGHPRVLPITFAVLGGHIWSAVDQKPKRETGGELARVRWLRAQPGSTITVDRYDDDWRRLAWIQVMGETSICELVDHGDVLAALAGRYPQYRKAEPPGPLLKLAPRRILAWRASG